MVEIIELPPQCFVCKDFTYNEEADELYGCKALHLQTNDIFMMWEDCPGLHRKYPVREYKED